MGHTLQPGVAVAAAIGVAHLRELTFEGALAFRPERFLDRKYSPFEFLPYGGGARRCLGAPLASYELRLIVGALLAGRRLRLASQRPDRGRVRAANVGPAHGVRVIVEAP
jgi:cytochrome P450